MLPKIKQCGKSKPHPAPLISNRSPTLFTTDLAGQRALMPVLITMVKLQQICSGREPNLMFMKDSRPLHRGTVQNLTGATVAELSIDGLSAHLITYPVAKASCPICGNKCRIAKGRVCKAELVVT